MSRSLLSPWSLQWSQTPTARKSTPSPYEPSASDKLAVRAFYQRFRRWWQQRIIHEKSFMEDHELARMQRQGDLRRMASEKRLTLVKEYFKLNPHATDKALVLDHFAEVSSRVQQGKLKFLDQRAVLLTFNGPWGEVTDIFRQLHPRRLSTTSARS